MTRTLPPGVCTHCERDRRRVYPCPCCGEPACRRCRDNATVTHVDEADARVVREFLEGR